MNDDKLYFYDDGIGRMVIGDPFGSTRSPSTNLHVEGNKIGISKVPMHPIHIVIGEDEYTDEDIRCWAEGMQGWSGWHASLLIRYLSQIIVSQVLDEE